MSTDRTTTYSNTHHPRLIKWLITSGIAAGIGFFILYVNEERDWLRICLNVLYFSCLYGAGFGGVYKLRSYTIDEENDTLTDSSHPSYPIRISNIETLKFKRSRRGRYRSLFIHDIGRGFMDVRTSEESAKKMAEHIMSLNQNIKTVCL